MLGALGGAGVAGISGYWVFGGHATHGTTRTVSVTAEDEIPDQHDIAITADLIEDTITSSRTARIRVTIRNTGPEGVFSHAGSGRCSRFNRSHGGSNEPPGLWLHRPEDAEYIDRDGTQWKVDRF